MKDIKAATEFLNDHADVISFEGKLIGLQMEAEKVNGMIRKAVKAGMMPSFMYDSNYFYLHIPEKYGREWMTFEIVLCHVDDFNTDYRVQGVIRLNFNGMKIHRIAGVLVERYLEMIQRGERISSLTEMKKKGNQQVDARICQEVRRQMLLRNPESYGITEMIVTKNGLTFDVSLSGAVTLMQ